MPKAILTGASSGLGRETARLLAAKGFQLVLVGRDEKSLKYLNEYPKSQIAILKADLTNPSDVSGLVDRALSLFSDNHPLTHIINCAGFAVSGRIEEIESVWFEKCWQVNFTSAVSLSQQALSHFKRTGTGTIFNVGSGVGRRAIPYHSPYCTAKAALHSFTDSLRVELQDTSIRAILFSPGPVQSNFHEATVHRGKTIPQFPPFRGVAPEQIAKRLVIALEGKSGSIFVGWKANLVHHLNYWFPKLVDWLLAKTFRLQPSTFSLNVAASAQKKMTL